MYPGEQLKYGWVGGGKASVPVPMAASQDVLYESGKFVFMNNGAATLCTAGSSYILGHLEYGEGTPTVGDEINCIVDPSAIYKIPITAGDTYLVGMIGDTTDLELDVNATGVQSAALAEYGENLIVILGGDATNNKWVLCQVNAVKAKQNVNTGL